ncbi:MAG: hypothetical protein JST68_18125 [Bacteroidetes bacterium]|nr:hypothetical protein [Bacteroidota bacterium]
MDTSQTKKIDEFVQAGARFVTEAGIFDSELGADATEYFSKLGGAQFVLRPLAEVQILVE